MERSVRVGFVGVGRMGRPMCRYILEAGFDLTVFDPVPDAVQATVEKGATPAGSAAEVAQVSDVVFVMAGFPDEVADAVAGPRGVLSGAPEGSVVVVSSSIKPGQAVALGDQCAARGVALLDAPVCRGERGAEEGRLLWLVGGEGEALDRVRPVMRPCGEDIFHVGQTGAGMVAKAVNNMLLWAALSADHEAIALTEAFDVDFARLVPALQLSSGSNWPLHNWEDTRRIPWAHKDMQQVLEMADEKGLSLPLSGLLREQVKPLMQKAGMAEGFIR